MNSNFPQLEPFLENGLAGFRGYLKGPRHVYGVLISAAIPNYPQLPPKVFMNPHAEGHHWYTDGSLCYDWNGWHWDPKRDTLAMALLVASKYLNDFD